MENRNFNPVIEAVVFIRHFAMAASDNWSSMKALGAILKTDVEEIAGKVDKYASENTKQKWVDELKQYSEEHQHLQKIMSDTILKIKGRSTEKLSEEWNRYPKHVVKIERSYATLKNLGFNCLPENERENWQSIWTDIINTHKKIKNEAEACGIQLKLIENYKPEEVDELTDTILKHIPFKYSAYEAYTYADEYMRAYEDIKKEASQKKNLWDKFLDLLAGGAQQTPAQRVMMQKWVDGEKGELH
ncbi:hypothetical protein M0D21_11625 [Aquimarina sp. D1M17]|uniref:hypothetical protein n=1 Tax=Aquimarina acroporae TaxID=2937283 RepID=UPI0020BEC88F|nr:hypothetical protein [Aquimarina acroporae]MCK8522224.1 hypothetical protein [Aquimarina acroporae]